MEIELDWFIFSFVFRTQRSVRFWLERPTKEHTQICCKINCLSFRIVKPVDYIGQTCKEYVLLAKVKSVSLKDNMISNWKLLLKTFSPEIEVGDNRVFFDFWLLSIWIHLIRLANVRVVFHYSWKVLFCMKSKNYYPWIMFTYTKQMIFCE